LTATSLKGHFLKKCIFGQNGVFWLFWALGQENAPKIGQNHVFFGFFQNVSRCHKMILIIFWDVFAVYRGYLRTLNHIFSIPRRQNAMNCFLRCPPIFGQNQVQFWFSIQLTTTYPCISISILIVFQFSEMSQNNVNMVILTHVVYIIVITSVLRFIQDHSKNIDF